MSHLLFTALDLAIRAGRETPEATVKRAEAYFTFLNVTTAPDAVVAATTDKAVTKPATPAKAAKQPVVDPTPAEVERPTLQGDNPSPQTVSEPEASAEEPVDASAASGSAEAQPSEDAPAADGAAIPDITEVNAAVLSYNRKFGREPTVALLKKYGGSKVPEIDQSRHAELLAELNAGLSA